MKWLADRVNVPLCQGESQFMKFGLQEMIDRHLISYVNPDVIHAGGISECKEIAAVSEAHFIDEAEAKKNPARPFSETRGTLRCPDGSVGDTSCESH